MSDETQEPINVEVVEVPQEPQGFDVTFSTPTWNGLGSVYPDCSGANRNWTLPASGAVPAIVSAGGVLPVSKTPSSATDTGTPGMICWDATYIYVCIAPNTWKRAAISTW